MGSAEEEEAGREKGKWVSLMGSFCLTEKIEGEERNPRSSCPLRIGANVLNRPQHCLLNSQKVGMGVGRGGSWTGSGGV